MRRHFSAAFFLTLRKSGRGCTKASQNCSRQSPNPPGRLPSVPSPGVLEVQRSSQRRRLKSSRAAAPAPELQAAPRPSQIVHGARQSRGEGRGELQCQECVCLSPPLSILFQVTFHPEQPRLHL